MYNGEILTVILTVNVGNVTTVKYSLSGSLSNNIFPPAGQTTPQRVRLKSDSKRAPPPSTDILTPPFIKQS